MKPSIEEINTLLPQTQCRECGYPGCLPYAQALHARQAPIHLCPPGGTKTLQALGKLLNLDPTPYLKDMAQKTRPPQLAKITESECIGCTKCIQACPVDAIIGATKFMHVILTNECTGCGLCVEPCPVDCIEMLPLPEPTYDPDVAKAQYESKQKRQLKIKQAKESTYREKRLLLSTSQPALTEKEAKRAYIMEALVRKKHE